MSTESVVVLIQSRPPGSSSVDFDNFYRDFLAFLQNPVVSHPNVQEEPFHTVCLKTKYYRAEVQVHRLVSPSLGSETFADSVEAVVLHFDAKLDPDLQSVDQWLAFIKHWEPSIRILTCDRVSEGKKVSTADWCVRNGYELIELHPDDESVAEAVDYGEEIGLSRLVQVLKAHSWSNLELSDEKDLAQAERLRGFLSAEEDTTDRDDGDFGDFQSAQIEAAADTVVLKENPVECGFSDNFSDHKAVRHCAGYAKLLAEKSEPSKDTDARPQSSGTDTEKSDISSVSSGFDSLSLLSSLQHDSHVEGLEEKTFEDLFKMFGEMKAKADQLPMGERKEFAERAVMAYWNAVGGDVTELEGLDSEEDD